MDERKASALLKKLAQRYAVGELSKQGYREQREAIIDSCEGLEVGIPQAEETPVNVVEPIVERFEGDETAIRAASSIVEESPVEKKRAWGLLIITLALVVGGSAVYIVYS